MEPMREQLAGWICGLWSWVVDLWSMRSNAFTGNHASSEKRVTRINVVWTLDGLHLAPLLLTPRQLVIAQHRSMAWPFAAASQCVHCKHVRINQDQAGVYTSSKNDSPVQIQLLVLLLLLFAFTDKYVLEEFSRLISSDGLVPVSHFLHPFYLLCGCMVLYCMMFCWGSVCEIWRHANQLLAHPEDAAYLPRSPLLSSLLLSVP